MTCVELKISVMVEEIEVACDYDGGGLRALAVDAEPCNVLVCGLRW